MRVAGASCRGAEVLELRAPDGYRLDMLPSAETMEEVFRLRVRAWRSRTDGFPQDLSTWRDEFDYGSTHFVLHHGPDIAAAARLTFGERPIDGPDGVVYSDISASDAPAPLAFISRLVVCEHHARRGLSGLLDAARIKHSHSLNCRTILANTSAGDARVRQLGNFGFRALYVSSVGSVGPLHRLRPPTVMALSLP